jgi:hypothetical protein
MAEKYGRTPFEYGFDVRLPQGVELDTSIFTFDLACFRAHLDVLAEEAKRASQG